MSALYYNPTTQQFNGQPIAPLASLSPQKPTRMSLSERDFYLRYFGITHQIDPVLLDHLTRRQPRSADEPASRATKRIARHDLVAGTHGLLQPDLTLLYLASATPLFSLEAGAIATQLSLRRLRPHLNKLVDQGLLDRWPAGYADKYVWSLAPKGYAYLNLAPRKLGNPVNSHLTHQLAVSYVTAHLIHGGDLNLLDLKEWPVHYRESRTGQPYRGDCIISERSIRRAINRSADRKFSGNRFHTLVLEHHALYKTWQQHPDTEPPEEQLNGERHHAWWLPSSEGYSQHIVDLVVNRPRRHGKPQSVHVEVELTPKPKHRYERLLTSLVQNPRNAFDHVVWVCGSFAIQQAIDATAQRIGLDETVCRTVRLRDHRSVFGKEDLLTRSAYHVRRH